MSEPSHELSEFEQLLALKAENANLKGLLKVSKCPNCDGNGVLSMVKPDQSERERSDGEMFYVQEQCQCQWCDLRLQALKEPTDGKNDGI